MIEVNDKIQVAHKFAGHEVTTLGQFSNLGRDWLEIKNPNAPWLDASNVAPSQVLIATSTIQAIFVINDA